MGDAPASPSLVESPLQSPTPVVDADDAALSGSAFTLAFEGLALQARRSALRRREPVLSNICGIIRGGVHAIVSTDDLVSRKALQVLAGIENRTSSGTVMANAIPTASSAFRQHVGFIASTDVCLLDATGRENLQFSLRMRLDTVHEAKIIRDTAEACGLSEHLDVNVEHLSQADRLRLSLAMELVLDPHVIFIEDPLRYLSVSDHYEFAAVLRRVSKSGMRTIVLSCHSLPWPLYDTLDGVILLSALTGKLLFCGAKAECERFLISEVLPDGVEVRGDSLLDLMVQWEDEGEVGHVANTFVHSAQFASVTEAIKKHKELVVSNAFHGVHKEITAPPPTMFAQNVLLLGYTVRRAVLRPDFVFSWIGLFVTFFLLAALSANQQHDQNGMQNKRGIIFSLLSCAMHVNIVFLDSEVSEYHSFVHMRNNRYFGVLQYFNVTVIRLLIPRLLFTVIGMAFTAFIFESAVPLSTLIGLTSFVHAVLLLLMTYWWPKVNDLTLTNLLYYAYCVMFSGFLVCVRSFPAILSDISLLRHGYGAAIAKELQGNPYSCDATVTVNITLNASYCYTGNQYLEIEGFDRDSWGRATLTLFLTSVVLLVLVLLSMKVAWVSRSWTTV